MATGTVVQLFWSTEAGIVTVTSKDEDRFNVKLQRALEILQQAHQAEQFHRQFKLLVRTLFAWLEKRRPDVHSAYLTTRDGAFSFLVVRNQSEYDEQFEDELSDLDFDIANDQDLNLIKMNAMSLPTTSEQAVDAFLDTDFAADC